MCRLRAVLGVPMVYATRFPCMSLQSPPSRIVQIDSSSVFVDDCDISTVISKQELTLFITFITAADTPLTCAVIYHILANRKQRVPDPCEECMKHDWSPSKCAHYRNIKNRITATRKVLELLRLGTITPAGAHIRDIRDAGWLMVPTPGMRVYDTRATASSP